MNDDTLQEEAKRLGLTVEELNAQTALANEIADEVIAEERAVQMLHETLTKTAERMRIVLDLKLESGDDWEQPGGVLVVDHGLLVVWYAEGKYHIDESVDTSDPTVGIFGGWEPQSWGGGEASWVVAQKTNADLEATAQILQYVYTRHLLDFLSDEAEARAYADEQA